MEPEIVVHECECEVCQAGFDRTVAANHHRMNLFLSRLNEPQKRWYVATLSEEENAPSDRELSLITGLDEKTIRRGREELQKEGSPVSGGKFRGSMFFSHGFHGFSLIFWENPCKSVKSVAEFSAFPVKNGRARKS